MASGGGVGGKNSVIFKGRPLRVWPVSIQITQIGLFKFNYKGWWGRERTWRDWEMSVTRVCDVKFPKINKN